VLFFLLLKPHDHEDNPKNMLNATVRSGSLFQHEGHAGDRVRGSWFPATISCYAAAPNDATIEPEDISSFMDLDSGGPPVDLSEPAEEPKYTVFGDCVLPVDYTCPGCMNIVCSDGPTCMGEGYCVPSADFELPYGDGTTRSKIALAEATNGGFAATWYENYLPPGETVQAMDIYFALFEADGTPVSAPVKVDQDTLPWARSPSMTRLLGGGFLIVWRAENGPTSEIKYMARVLDPDGQPVAPVFQLNETPLKKEFVTGTNVDSSFTKLLRSYSVAVTWMGQKDGPTVVEPGGVFQSKYPDVYLRVLSPEGDLVNGEMDTGGALLTTQESSPVVTDTPQGGVAIYWHHRVPPPLVPKDGEPPDGPLPLPGAVENQVKGRIFDQAAEPLGEPFQVSPETQKFEGMPCSTTLKNGEMFVTWRTSMTDGTTTSTSIRGQLLGLSGEPLGAEKLFGEDPKGYYPFYAPTGSPDPNRVFVVWHTIEPALDGVYLRRYYMAEDIMDCETTTVSGAKVPGESGNRRLPAVLTFEDGRTLIGWQSSFNGSAKLMLRYMK